jgi:hypothetical protein
MIFLEFTQYQELGGKLSETEFYRAERYARVKILSLAPQLRIKNDDDLIWDDVKFLQFELIERGYLGKLDGADKTSESNDGRSVSWESKEGKADNLIKDFLALLFSQGGITIGGILKT